MDYIKEKVHELYYKYDINCARTTLVCLSELFGIKIEEQTCKAAVGLHGGGGFRGQCGLVEGGLMFIGIYFTYLEFDEKEIVSLCYDYSKSFTEQFGSLRCFDLRPGGFREDDPPHLCEELTCKAIDFTYRFIIDAKGEKKNGKD